MAASRPINRTALVDRLLSIPLLALYALAIGGTGLLVWTELPGAAWTLNLAVLVVSQVATIAFNALQMALILLRRPPERTSQGVLPTLAGVAGFTLPLAFARLPRPDISWPLALASSALVAVGVIGATAVLFWLGRAFAILPQARGLVTGGPYRLIRHPLYLFELISVAGVSLQYAQPWASLVALAVLAVQIPRMGFEEQILSEAYPAYAAYKARTRRLIPGLY